MSALARRYASDARRVERVLGAARVALSFACLFAVVVGSSLPIEHPLVVRWVLATYTVESLIVYRLANVLTGGGFVAPLILHIADFALATACSPVNCASRFDAAIRRGSRPTGLPTAVHSITISPT